MLSKVDFDRIEGRINYRIVQHGKYKGSFKEYWFKLTGNLLFYFNLNSFGGIKGNVRYL